MKGVLLSLVLLLFTNITTANTFDNFLSNKQTKPLDVTEAFQPEIVLNKDSIDVNFNIQPKHYLYKDKIHIYVNDKELLMNMPIALDKLDPVYGQVKIFEGYTTVKSSTNNINIPDYKIKVVYQGCSEEFSICYPVETLVKNLKNESYNPNIIPQDLISKETTSEVKTIPTVNYDDSSSIVKLIANENSIVVVFMFLGFGLLMAFTPCVFPMVPILSSIIVKHDKKHPFVVSLLYVIGMGLCYASIGFILKLFNFNIQIALQNKYILIATALFMLLLASSMFGLINFRLPYFIQNKIHDKTEKLDKNKNPLSLIAIGYLSALMLSPCAVAPLAGTLLFASQYDSIVYSSFLLFILGLGSGIPLILWGTSFKKLLPKTGVWMYEIKYVMGMLMVFTSFYLLDKIIPFSTTDTLSPIIFKSLLITTIIAYLAKFIKIDIKSKIIIVLISFITILSSNFNPNVSEIKIPHIKDSFIRINSLQELNKEINGKSLVYVGADWCTSCKQMESSTLKDPEVIKNLREFKVLYLDITEMTDEKKKVLEHFNLQIAPFYVLYNSMGKKDNDIYIGYLNKEKFLEILHKIH